MSIYSKKLKSVADLEREKKRLSKKMSALEQEDLFSADTVLAGLKSGADGGMLTGLMGMLPISGLVKDLVANVSSGLKQQKKAATTKEKTKPREPQEVAQETKPKRTNKLKTNVRTVVLEVLFGYAKWKAIELSYKAIKHLVSQPKTEKRASITPRK